MAVDRWVLDRRVFGFPVVKVVGLLVGKTLCWNTIEGEWWWCDGNIDGVFVFVVGVMARCQVLAALWLEEPMVWLLSTPPVGEIKIKLQHPDWLLNHLT